MTQVIHLKNAKWFGILFLASAWMFVLGIFVGRGMAPVTFDIEKLQKELIAKKEAQFQEERDKFKQYMEEAQKNTGLGFYEALKTDEARDEKSLSSSKAGAVHEEKNGPISDGVSLNGENEDIANPDANPILPSENDEKNITIQIASLKDITTADNMVKLLKEQGYQNAYRSVADIPGKGVWYRVRVGYYIDKAEAQETLNRLKQAKYSPMLIKEQ